MAGREIGGGSMKPQPSERYQGRALNCGKCGCFYREPTPATLNPGNHKLYAGSACEDHSCRCGHRGCWPKHICGGKLEVRQ
jgi:hypothetical protein